MTLTLGLRTADRPATSSEPRPLLKPDRVAEFSPRPPQQAAAQSIVDTFDGHAARAQLRMACGVGKTMVGVLTAAATRSSRVVVVVPGISLVDQTLRAWTPFLTRAAQTVAVCSADGLFTSYPAAVGPRVTTTDPGRIGFLLEQDSPTLVVATYQSLPRVAEALQQTGVTADLLILDEAHHLTGRLSPAQRIALDNQQLPSARRLAMTATPVIATDADAAGAPGFDPFSAGADVTARVSMDDHQLFGPVAHLYTTRQAIDDGYLCDYDVLVVSRIDTPFNRERLPLAALAAAANDRGAARALAFHSWVADARAFKTQLNLSSSDSVRFVADTITAATPAIVRRRILTRLADPCAPGVMRVVTTAQCLREGVDVCAVDAVLFAAPRSSTTEIIQAVGRALRVHPGKQRGTIVLPLLLPAGAHDDEELTSSQFAHIWKILRALNAHDPRVAESLTRERGPASPRGPQGSRRESRDLPDWLHVVGGINTDTIVSRLVTPDSSQWDSAYEAFAAAAAGLGSAHRVKNIDVHAGRRVGDWAVGQRFDYHRGVLDPARAERLVQIPGWVWTEQGLLDHRMVDRLEDVAAAAGTCRDTAAGPSTYPSVPGSSNLGRWLARARRSHRENRFGGAGVAARLEQLPGWTWEPLDPGDRAGVEALATYVAWEHTAVVPAGHLEDGFPLATWLDRLARLYLVKRLSPELHEEILAVCPTNAKGDPVFAWDINRIRAQIALLALRQYAAAGGDVARVPTGHQEVVDGVTVNVYQWCARVRWLSRRGKLDPELRRQLEELPGWRWEPAQRFGPPIPLPPGIEHGRPTSRTHFSCPCEPCTTASRDYQANFKRDQLEGLRRGWVTTPAGGRRAASLLARHSWATPAAVAAAACMPRPLLGELLTDPTTRVPQWIARRLERLTEQQVRTWHRDGTRGRVASAASAAGDPSRHAEILARLRTAGWTSAQISTALGYRGNNAGARRTQPSAAAVYALEQLVAAIGPQLTVPAWAVGLTAPRLERTA